MERLVSNLFLSFEPASIELTHAIHAASNRARKPTGRPLAPPTNKGRKRVHDLAAWLPGMVARVDPARANLAAAVGRGRGYVVASLGGGILYRIA